MDLLAPMPAEIADLRDRGQPMWIFAYGSLLWDPEFSAAEAEPAVLHGWHRSFCIYSYDYRGTPARPGLVLGLDRGGSCRGVILGLPAEAIDRVWSREMSGRRVYETRLVPVRTVAGIGRATAFTALRDCPDYAGRLPLDAAAQIILGASGRRGSCREYFDNTLNHLARLGLVDRPLRRLAEHIQTTMGRR